MLELPLLLSLEIQILGPRLRIVCVLKSVLRHINAVFKMRNIAGPDGELPAPVSPSNTELTFQFLLGQRTVNISLTQPTLHCTAD